MPWVAKFKEAVEGSDGTATIIVTFTRTETGEGFDDSFTFRPGDPLTKAAVKALVQPKTDALNGTLNKITTANTTLVGQDIATW